MGRGWTISRFVGRRQQEPETNGPTDDGRAARDERAVATDPSAASALRATADVLGKVLQESECEIGRLAGEFEAMAQATQAMVDSAAAIVGCSDGERVQSVLTNVHQLGEATRSFLHRRLESTAGIVETVTAEAGLLARLAQQTQAQKGIVRETAMLRVLTNIEVARLGEVGAGFEYLARELDDFATAVAESIGALTAHTAERRTEIDATRRTLTAELPHMREEYAGLEAALARVQTEVDRTLEELKETPARFQDCVRGIAQQIAGVVAAIQANDITRQQMEHVQAALSDVAGAMETGGAAAEVAAGLAIQSYQVRSIRATVEGWTGQIRMCLEGIAHLAAAEMLELGRGVAGRERELTRELTRIEQLEEQCAEDNAKVQASLAGIAGLMQLVSEHLERSRAVRERLQLLMFNSIVEASHLGAQADGILEISNTIKRLSGEWSALTQQSEGAMQEIRTLVEQSHATMEAFSGGAQEQLRGAREQTRAGLAILREAARCAESRGQKIQGEAGALQGRVSEVRAAGERLERSLARLAGVLTEIDAVCGAAGDGRRDAASEWDPAAMERRFGSTYTTEMERAVLRAALKGDPLPIAQADLAGNSVELF
jgi:methyl-accepting chemotaxis protein